MKFVADVHLHSHYSRATSKNLTLEYLSRFAQLKGIQVVGTGDLVHPGWLNELKEKLEPAEEGFFKLRSPFSQIPELEVLPSCLSQVRFMIAGEISNIYKKGDRVRKIHSIVFVPSFQAAERLQSRLERIGNLRADGRPILGLDARDLLEIVLGVDPQAYLIPAHIWTPWFSALGSKSGFNSIPECFADLSSHIFALETGLSSDPLMNWRLSQLDPYVLVSNSDAHSPAKLGREATVYDTEFSYRGIYAALSDPQNSGLHSTIEFFPEEGKYHFDGHRKCEMRLHPRETVKHNGICPKCGGAVTVGVMARVEELADRPEGQKPKRWKPYFNLIPLIEIISEVLQVGPLSQQPQNLMEHLLSRLGNELKILKEVPIHDIERCGGALLSEGIKRVRTGQVSLLAGYDGEYGKISLFSQQDRRELESQIHFKGEDWDDPVIPSESTITTLSEIPKPAISKKPSTRNLSEITKRKHLDINPAQLRAIRHHGSNLLIIAGPGTGKTFTLAKRIEFLVKNDCPSREIMAITFTNRAAEAILGRLKDTVEDSVQNMTVGTFHSVCLQILRNTVAYSELPLQFKIASSSERDRLIHKIWPTVGRAEIKKISEMIVRCKSSGDKNLESPEVHQYNQALRERGLLDYDDLILEVIALFNRNLNVLKEFQVRFRYVFVDEFQDINPIQYQFLKLFKNKETFFTAIGDPHQSIYGFRGSDIHFFEKFIQDFSETDTIHLSENYRSAVSIVKAAGQVIEKEELKSVPLLTAQLASEGKLVIHQSSNSEAEAEYVAEQIEKLMGGTSLFSRDTGKITQSLKEEIGFGDFAVLYRLNSQRNFFQEVFERCGIPYQISGEQPLYEKKYVREMISHTNLILESEVTLDDALLLFRNQISGWGDKLSDNLREEWGSKVPMVSLEELNEQSVMFDKIPESIKRQYQNFVSQCKRLRINEGTAQFQRAIESLVKFERWTKLFSEYPLVKENWHRLKSLAAGFRTYQGFLDYVLLQKEEDDGGTNTEKVSLLTLHAAKGLEFAVVFITGCEGHLIPLQRLDGKTDLAEERRLFYVGMTRAKETLYLTSSRIRILNGKVVRTQSSPFLSDIDEMLKEYENEKITNKINVLKSPINQLELFS